MEVFYRQPSQDDSTDEFSFKELRNIYKSATLVLKGDLNLPDVKWEHHTAATARSRRFLEHLDGNLI